MKIVFNDRKELEIEKIRSITINLEPEEDDESEITIYQEDGGEFGFELNPENAKAVKSWLDFNLKGKRPK